MPTSGPAGDTDPGSLGIRPPLQKRSREAWTRVLDAGVALLEEGGYEAFTISAVCKRGNVAPRALYARADTKDALFLAVYEHGLARVRSDHSAFTDQERWRERPSDQIAEQAVREVAGIFARHAAFLRSVILISGVHPEVRRRGAFYTQELGDHFAGVLMRAQGDIDDPRPEDAVRTVFGAVFSTLALRSAYGPAFATPAADDRIFLDGLVTMARRYLFGRR